VRKRQATSLQNPSESLSTDH